MRWLALVCVAVLAGCKSDSRESDDLYMDDDVPAGSCMSESGSCETDTDVGDDSTAADAGPCVSTAQCGAGEMCIATFDGDIGEFACRGACIDDMDETRWCLDDAACCTVGAVCSQRGYCIGGDSTSTGTGG